MPNDGGIEDAYYFGAEPEQAIPGQWSFLSWLQLPRPSGPGLRVKSYWLKRKSLFWPDTLGGQQVVHPETGQPFELTYQKAVDVGLAFHLLLSYANRGWKKLFLAAGDADFHEPVQYLVEHENISLFLIGLANTIAPELQSHAKAIVWLDEIADQISRPKSPRPPTG